MLRFRPPSLLVPVFVLLTITLPFHAASSQPRPSTGINTLTVPELQQLATVHVALLKLQDSLNAEMAHPRNKTREGQERLQAALRSELSSLIERSGLSADEFQRRRFVVSTNDSLRAAFEEAITRVTGVASRGGERTMATLSGTPTTPAATPAREAAGSNDATSEALIPASDIAMPAGAVGTHVAHVLVRFPTTPDKLGLLAVARAEAKTAAQHAALAARAPGNLQSMQTHAGHVLHALDPTVVTAGPGTGYGLKKAAVGVASHVELAAKSEGASAGVQTHAEHVATAARSTMERADEIIAIAQRIRAATDAPQAAALVGQMTSLCEQLESGIDLDADGRVNWGGGEGGLQQADAHMQLLLTASRP